MNPRSCLLCRNSSLLISPRAYRSSRIVSNGDVWVAGVAPGSAGAPVDAGPAVVGPATTAASLDPDILFRLLWRMSALIPSTSAAMTAAHRTIMSTKPI